MIVYPSFDPVAVEVFGFGVRWYGIMYLIGFAIAWAIGHQLLKKASFSPLRGLVLEDLVVAAAIGVIIGGRLGYVLFYNPAYYAEHPLEILYLWNGGMSFHGGLIGVIVGLWVLARLSAAPTAHPPRQPAPTNADANSRGGGGVAVANVTSQKNIFLRLVDFAAVLTPPGLGLGRLGNFINGELPGRVASLDLPWAMSFGYPDDLPRHPSQLYQLFIEGFVLTALMLYLSRTSRAPGWLAGVFLVAYSLGRFFVEFFREPDSHLGLLFLQLSMGQLLSIPMFLLGLAMLYRLKINAWRQVLGGADGKLTLKELLRRMFAAESDISWSEHEKTFAENYGDEQEEEVPPSRIGNFFNRLFGDEEVEEEPTDTGERLTRQQKRRLKKKRKK